MNMVKVLADTAAEVTIRPWYVELFGGIAAVAATAATVVIAFIQVKGNSKVTALEIKLEFAMEKLKTLEEVKVKLEGQVLALQADAIKTATEMAKRDQRILALETEMSHKDSRIAMLENQNSEQAKTMQGQSRCIKVLEEEASRAEEALRMEVEQFRAKKAQ